jgi:hypothetical protein
MVQVKPAAQGFERIGEWTGQGSLHLYNEITLQILIPNIASTQMIISFFQRSISQKDRLPSA